MWGGTKVGVVAVQLHYLHIARPKGLVETPNLVGVHTERVAKLAGTRSIDRMALTVERMQRSAEDKEDEVAAARSRAPFRVF